MYRLHQTAQCDDKIVCPNCKHIPCSSTYKVKSMRFGTQHATLWESVCMCVCFSHKDHRPHTAPRLLWDHLLSPAAGWIPGERETIGKKHLNWVIYTLYRYNAFNELLHLNVAVHSKRVAVVESADLSEWEYEVLVRYSLSFSCHFCFTPPSMEVSFFLFFLIFFFTYKTY